MFLASSYGLTPDDWQEDILDDWLGRRRDGRWSAATCGLAVPRQNGKNGVIEVRELYGMVQLGEKFLHTAHEVKTARKAFLRIASFFENTREYPELAEMVKEIRKTNGQEAVVLDNGGSVEFIARSKGSGRGFTVDVLVLDEAQDLSDDELAALLPTISVAPSRNPQVIFTGTPPDPMKLSQGEVWRRLRADGQTSRDKRLSWTDYGAADGPMPDVDDRDLWARHNPTLGHRLAIGEVEREHALLAPEDFAAERLGWWGDPARAADNSTIDLRQWSSLKGDADPNTLNRCVLTIDVDPTRLKSSIGVSARVGVNPLGMVKTGAGTTWVAAEIKRLASTRDIAEVVLGPAALFLMPTIVNELGGSGVEVDSMTVGDTAQACAAFQEAVKNGSLMHLGQPELDAAVANARTRNRGEGEIWDRRDRSIDISPLVAVSNGMWRLSSAVVAEPTVFFV